MNSEPDHPTPDIDPRELQLSAHALGELTEAERDALAEALADDAAAKRTAAEMKVIADALRDAHDVAELPPASPELRAALDNYLTNTHLEERVVTKSPDVIPPARRRFTPLEIILSIAVVCLGALVVLMNARGQVQTALIDTSASLANSDQSYGSDSDLADVGDRDLCARHEFLVHPPRRISETSDLDQSRTPHGSVHLENRKSTIDGITTRTKEAVSGDTYESDPSDWLGMPASTESTPPPAWVTEYYRRGGRRDGKVMMSLESSLDLETTFRNVDGAVVMGGFDADVDGLADHWFEDGRGGDQYARIYENNFKVVTQEPLSTFSIDVDTASYSKMRQHILEHGQLPPPDAIRIEELVNYFPYDYLEPMDEHPFAAHMEVAQCPWKAEHRLARIAIKGKEMKPDARPASNLVFLVDVSGSMNEANKLPLVKRGLEMLTRELTKNDRVAIVVYAGAAGLVLPSTSGEETEAILAALEKLEAGGSTAGAEGINLAYQTAQENFIHAGVNRVILCTDGDFNVGVSDTGSLVRLAEEQAKKNVFLSILGFGIGNLNDEMLEEVSGKANGMYAFIDTENEARKVLVEQMSGTLVTIAKDVKIQIEFNPTKVAAYRLIGYENRILAAEDFNDDKKDAGEIGAGHTITALYEIVPVVAKEKPEVSSVDALKYQKPSELTDAADSDELLTLKLRYKSPEGEKSTLLSEPVDDNTEPFGKVSDDFKFAAAVASFGMLLRGSEYAGDATLDSVLEIATDGAKVDKWGYRKEFLEMVKRAKELKK